MNAAYRGSGDDAVQSWNQEVGILEGSRTDDSLLKEEASAPGAHLLVHRDLEDRTILGTVLLVAAKSDSWYLGVFTVRPALQNRHLGRALLSEAEEFARARGASSIQMGVLNVRSALIARYERRGYTRSGEIEPFPYGDKRFGKPLRSDLEFVVLRKYL